MSQKLLYAKWVFWRNTLELQVRWKVETYFPSATIRAKIWIISKKYTDLPIVKKKLNIVSSFCTATLQQTDYQMAFW